MTEGLYYYSDGVSVKGPHTKSEMEAKLKDGSLNEESLVLGPGKDSWVLLKEINVLKKSNNKTEIKYTFGFPYVVGAIAAVLAIIFTFYISSAREGARQTELSQELYESIRQSAEEREKESNMRIDDAVANGQIIKGMREIDVLSAWGAPTKKSSMIMGNFRFEEWFYDKRRQYVTFLDNGNQQTVQSVTSYSW